MTNFKCPNCNKHSNRFYNKCPDCGYIRFQSGEDQIGESTSNRRERERKRRLIDSNFRGGRNQTLVRMGNKPDSKGKDK